MRGTALLYSSFIPSNYHHYISSSFQSSEMPVVEVEASTGKVLFDYVICTPTSENSPTIDRSLPTVLFIHATAIAQHVFHSQFADPQLRSCNLVAFDLRGHGATGGDKVPFGYGQVEAAEDVTKLMDALQLPPCHIVAMSLGSTIACQLAITYPSRVLSLFFISHLCLEELPDISEGHKQVHDTWISAFPDPSTMNTEPLMECAYGVSQYMFSNNITNLGRALIHITVPVAQRIYGYENLDVYRIVGYHFFIARKAHSKAALARISCPVKLVYGTGDVVYPLSYTEEFLSDLKEAGVDASLLIVPNAPHFVCVDYGREINPAIHDFVIANSGGAMIRPTLSTDVVRSPWDAVLKEAGWDPDDNEYDSNLIIHTR